MTTPMLLQKIYWNNNPFIVTPNAAEFYKHFTEARKVAEFSYDNISEALTFLDSQDAVAALIIDTDVDPLIQTLASRFTKITAAGGIVRNEANEILLIQRRGFWDLPKGKLEKGEAIPTCAVREVEEETGLVDVQLLDFACNTYHLYNMFNQDVLKTTYWYNMKVKGEQQLQPQLEEDITEIKWVKTEDLPIYLTSTFETIKDVLSTALS